MATDLVPVPPNLPAGVRREHEAQLAQIEATYRVTLEAGRLQGAAAHEATREAVRRLERIGADVGRSTLPADQKAHLLAQVDQAYTRHGLLMEQANQAAQARLRQAVETPVRASRGLVNRFSDELVDTLDDVADALFRW